MRNSIVLIALVLAGGLISCNKTNSEPSFKSKILGKWRVVATNNFRNDSGIVVEWGGYYVNSVTLNKDDSFAVNGGPGSAGTWKLKDYDKKIVFYVFSDFMGTHFADTTEFKISIDTNEDLIFQQGTTIYRHKKIN